MTKAKPKSNAGRKPIPVEDRKHSSLVIRVDERLKERLRIAGFKARTPPSVLARQLIEAGLKQKRGAAIALACLAAVNVVRPAHGQSLPPLQPPSDVWCTNIPAPQVLGRPATFPRQCGTVAQWRDATTKACLVAEAIGKPAAWTQDNASPYWAAANHCFDLTMGRDKVEQTAREAATSYQNALAARRRLDALAGPPLIALDVRK